MMPASELLLAEPVVLTVSLAAIIARPGERVTCARSDEEIINQREVRVDGQPLCRGCAGTAYHARVTLADPTMTTASTASSLTDRATPLEGTSRPVSTNGRRGSGVASP